MSNNQVGRERMMHDNYGTVKTDVLYSRNIWIWIWMLHLKKPTDRSIRMYPSLKI